MPKLLKKIFFIFLILIFLLGKKDSAFAVNPQAILEDTSLQKYIDDQNKAYQQAASTGTMYPYNASVRKSDSSAAMAAFIDGNLFCLNLANAETCPPNQPRALNSVVGFMGTLYGDRAA